MATYRGIAAVGQAILSLLEEGCPKPEFTGAEFKLYGVQDFKDPIPEGASLYLYRVTVNPAVRNTPPRLGPDGRHYRPSLPVDLHYLLTVWGKNAVKQQRLLGWCMRELENTQTLPASLLNNPGPEPGVFDSSESVEITLDHLSTQDWANITDPIKADMQLSVPYIARLVRVDSDISMQEFNVVQTRIFGLGKLVHG